MSFSFFKKASNTYNDVEKKIGFSPFLLPFVLNPAYLPTFLALAVKPTTWVAILGANAIFSEYDSTTPRAGR